MALYEIRARLEALGSNWYLALVTTVPLPNGLPLTRGKCAKTRATGDEALARLVETAEAEIILRGDCIGQTEFEVIELRPKVPF